MTAIQPGEETGPDAPAAVSTPRRSRRVPPQPLGSWWLPVLATLLVLASDFPIRRRADTDALSGAVDVNVLLELAVYGFVGAYLAAFFLRTSGPRPTSRGLLILWIYVGVMGASVLLANGRNVAIARLFQLVVAAALAQVAVRHGRRADFHRLAHVLIAIATIGSLVGLIFGDFFPAPPEGRLRDRLSIAFTHPVIAGMIVCLGLVLAVAYLRRRGPDSHRAWPGWAYGLCILVNVVFMADNLTRTAMGGAAAAVVVVLFAANPARALLDRVALLAVVVVFTVIFGSSQITEIVERGESVENLATFNNRTPLWDYAISSALERPVLGYGYYTARGFFLEDFGLGGAHNSALEVLINAGFLGLASWLALLYAIGRPVVAASFSRRPLSDGPILAGVFVYLLVTAFSQGQLGQAANTFSLVLFLLLGWVTAGYRERSEAAAASGDRR